MEHKFLHPNRRQALAKIGLAITSTLFTPFIWARSQTTPKQIVVRDVGGIVTQKYKEFLYQPFTQATGIKVIGVSATPHPVTQIQSMVRTKKYLWDMAALADFDVSFLTSTQEKFFEPHELECDPIISSISSQFISPLWVGTNVYSSVLAYRTNVFKKSKAPESWADLWNIAEFPARRGLRRAFFETIEIALMADGIAPDKIYPCDLNRVFRSLDKIKPHVDIWWQSAPQSEQLLKTGEVDLIHTFVVRAQAARDAGLPVAFSWNQHIYCCENWAILKGTPNANLCRQFIQFASHPKRQALLAKYGIGPTHPEALQYIKPEHNLKFASHPDNLKKGIHSNSAYWVKNHKAVTERFNEWMLS